MADDDSQTYHRQSRIFHLGLTRPSGMLRLIHMLESAWNITEPVQVMVHVEHAQRARLHEDHGEMLDAFLARDVERLLASSAAHHRRLNEVVATLPPTPDWWRARAERAYADDDPTNGWRTKIYLRRNGPATTPG